MKVVSSKVITAWFLFPLGIVLILLPILFLLSAIIDAIFFSQQDSGRSISDWFGLFVILSIPISVGYFLISNSISSAWELAISEDGIRLRNIILRKTRSIKYDEIKKVKRVRYSECIGRTGCPITYRQLEIELTSKEKDIVFSESRLKNLIETHQYIRDKVSEVSQNIESENQE